MVYGGVCRLGFSHVRIAFEGGGGPHCVWGSDVRWSDALLFGGPMSVGPMSDVTMLQDYSFRMGDFGGHSHAQKLSLASGLGRVTGGAPQQRRKCHSFPASQPALVLYSLEWKTERTPYRRRCAIATG